MKPLAYLLLFWAALYLTHLFVASATCFVAWRGFGYTLPFGPTLVALCAITLVLTIIGMGDRR